MRPLLTVLLALLLVGCRQPVTLSLELPLNHDEKKWFIEQLLFEFEQQEGIRVDLYTSDAPASKADVFALSRPQLTPKTQRRSRSVAQFWTGAGGEFFEPALELGEDHFLPLFLNPRVLVYSRSRVLEAYLGWESRRDEIEGVLKRYNGSGLPDGYSLEVDPDAWDLYDLVVLSLYWGQESEPRVALGFDPAGALGTFAELAYASGATLDELLRGKGPGVRNAHYWLSFFEDSQTLPWSAGESLPERLAQAELWLGFLDIRQVFSLYRGDTPDRVLSDLAVAPLPRGVSFYLNGEARPFFPGRHRALMEGYFLGVSPDCRHPEEAAALVAWLLSDAVQQRTCEYLGYLPVKSSLQDNILSRFREDWIKDLFLIGLEQLQGDTARLPISDSLATLQDEMASCFFPPRPYERAEIDFAVYNIEKKLWDNLQSASPEPQPAGAAASSSLSGRRRLVFWQMDQGEAYSKLVEAAITEFEAQHPEVLVETRDLPMKSDEQLQIYLDSFAQGSDAFDVLAIDVIWVGEFGRSGYLAALDPKAARQDRFMPSLIQACTVNGKLMALPWYVNSGLTFYRKDLLAQAGLQPPRDYAELMATLLRRPQGVDGLVFQGREYEGLVCCFLEFFHGSGERLYSDDYRRTAVSRQRLTEILTDFRALFVKGVVPPDVLYFQEEESRLHFLDGGAMFLRNWPYVWASVNKPEDPLYGKVGIAPPLAYPGKAPRGVLGGWQLAVNSRSQHPQLAAEFIGLLTSEKFQKRMCLELGRHPTLDALYQDPEVLKSNPLLEELHQVFSEAQPRPAVSRYPLFSVALQRELTALMLGVITAEEAAAEISALLEQFKAP